MSIRNIGQRQAGFTEIPEGYMTSEQFRHRAITKVNQFCDKHGIINRINNQKNENERKVMFFE